ncbi:uncharacterized protein C8A04DRAFT_28300 [Dichotomopilus funicola]|uniref:Uncharacterized protein n=1 Tax=Dichotomopilus funicola TaxID=1934379 RepID=A0AAN6V353_9PEZI|nr:hypothetical protein C8A04DRAFT_28300 [Dichotomopilus funicola]
MPSNKYRRPPSVRWSSDVPSTTFSLPPPPRPSTPHPSAGLLNPPPPSDNTSQLYDFVRHPYLRDSEAYRSSTRNLYTLDPDRPCRSSTRETYPHDTFGTRHSSSYYAPLHNQTPSYYGSRARSVSRGRDRDREYRSPTTPRPYHRGRSRSRDPISTTHLGSTRPYTYQPPTTPTYATGYYNPPTGSHTYGGSSLLYDPPTTLYDRPSGGGAYGTPTYSTSYPRRESSRRRSSSLPRRREPPVTLRDSTSRERPFYGELRYEVGERDYPEGAWLYDPLSTGNRRF